MNLPNILNIRPAEIIDAALRADDYNEVVTLLEHSMHSEDKWIVNACVVAIEYLARDFDKYPLNVKEFLWDRRKEFQEFFDLQGSIYNAELEFREGGALGI